MSKYHQELVSHQQSDQEANEGFVIHKIIVENHDNIIHQQGNNVTNSNRPVDFQPRYIRSSVILKKEPEEIYQQGIQNFPIYSQQIRTRIQIRKGKQNSVPIYDFYMKTKDYRMIYHRIQRPYNEELQNNFTANPLDLKHILEYKSINYALLKQFKSTNLTIQNPKELIFDSCFESGNLMYVFQTKEAQNQYHLLMQNDVNTKGYNQWFYFSVTGAIKGKQYKFRITNFRKKASLFAEGMKPVMFSLQAYKTNKNGWSHNFSNVKYQKTNICKNNNEKDIFYCLEFTFSPQYDRDCIFIAMRMPYSYSKLNRFIKQIQDQLQNKQNIDYKRDIIAHSIANNAIPLITITSNKNDSPKRMIGIMARQHPGQTWSSYLMQKLIIELLSDTKYAIYLRDNYIFKIFPMINVDGVIYGNFRCDINGMDLNRQWKYPNQYLHPQICAIKTKMLEYSKMSQFDIFIDLHGHSKKYNSFFYSCQKDYQNCRVLPFILQKFSNSFSLPDCTFGISREKENTARAFLFGLLQKDNILTLQLSFFGIKKLQAPIQVYLPTHMKSLAQSLLKAIFVYLSKNQCNGIVRSDLEQEMKSKLKQFSEYDKNNQNDSGSESDPYIDEIQLDILKSILPISTHRNLELNHKFQHQCSPVKLEIKNSQQQIIQKSPKKEFVITEKVKKIKKKVERETSIKSQIKKGEGQKITLQKRKTRSIIKTKIQSKQYATLQINRNNKSPMRSNNRIIESQQPQKKMSATRIYKQRKYNFNPVLDVQVEELHSLPNKPITPHTQKSTLYPLKQNRQVQSAHGVTRRFYQQSQDQQLAKRIQKSIVPMYKKLNLYKNDDKISSVPLEPKSPISPAFKQSRDSHQINYPMIGMVPNFNSFVLKEEPRHNLGWKNREIINFEKYKKKSQKQKPIIKLFELSKALSNNSSQAKNYENLAYTSYK